VDADAGVVHNTASVHGTTFFGTGVDATSDPVDVAVTHPGIWAFKAFLGNADEDGSQSISAGDTLSYALYGYNTGDVELHDVTLVDNLAGSGPVVCPDNYTGDLATGTFVVCLTTYVVTPADVANGSITNTATAYNEVVSSTSDPVTVATTALLTLTNMPDRSSAVAGEEVTFTIEVANAGGQALTDVHVTDPGLGFEDTIAYLGVGESRTYAVIYQVTNDDAENGRFENTAFATSTQTPLVEATAGVDVSAEAQVLDASIPPSESGDSGTPTTDPDTAVLAESLPVTGGHPDGLLWMAAALCSAGAAYLAAGRRPRASRSRI
jgi:hypothetical protein